MNDFQDGISNPKNHKTIVKASKNFAYIIANKIKSKNIFNTVDRNNNDLSANTLLIDGDITEYDEGHPIKCALIGFDTDNSHFNVTINIKDNQSK
ncbi:MAG: DUF4410 domain-containing protein [Rickettsiales endosymbiont of Dermacentor nuttalli]